MNTIKEYQLWLYRWLMVKILRGD